MNKIKKIASSYRLSSYGLLSISGTDAKKFLQGQLTCHLDEISSTQTRLGAHCNPQGRLLFLFRIYWFQNQYLLQMPLDLIPIALAALKKYAVFFKVTLENRSEQFKLIGYIGEQLFADKLPQKKDAANNVSDFLITKISDRPSRYIFLSENHVVFPDLPVENQEHIWKSFDIAAGIPAVYPLTSGKFLPHEINLPLLDGVSFNKGCYTGQEIIARIEYRGALKTHMIQASVTTTHTPKAGDSIYNNKEHCGSIVDSCQIEYNHFMLLILIPKTIETVLSLDPEQKIILNLK